MAHSNQYKPDLPKWRPTGHAPGKYPMQENFEAFSHFQALIFDMDGTLVDSGKLHETAWTQALTHYEIPIDRKTMRSLAGIPAKETVDILLNQFEHTLRHACSQDVANYKERFVQDHFEKYVQGTQLVKLVKYYAKRKPMAVGTGAKTSEAIAVLKACNILEYFDYIVGADQVKSPKPAPETFLLCAEKLNVHADTCIVFEDSQLGIDAAKSAGMQSIDVLKAFNIVNDYFLH